MVSQTEWEHYLVFSYTWMGGSGLDFYLQITVQLLNLRLLENFQIYYKEKAIFLKCETLQIYVMTMKNYCILLFLSVGTSKF